MGTVLIKRSPRESHELVAIDVKHIKNPRWDCESGGVGAKTSYYVLYGYIDYTLASEILEGCSGKHDYGFNDAKIYIPREPNLVHNEADYRMLEKQAGEKPYDGHTGRPSGIMPCTQAVLSVLAEAPSQTMARKDLQEKVAGPDYGHATVRDTIKRLGKQKRIILEGDYRSPNQKVSLAK